MLCDSMAVCSHPLPEIILKGFPALSGSSRAPGHAQASVADRRCRNKMERYRLKIAYTPTVFFLLAGLPLAMVLLRHGWRNRTRPGGLPFVVLIALATAWAVEAALELL